MTEALLRRSDEVLVNMSRSVEVYNEFVKELLGFVKGGESDVPHPSHHNVTFVMNTLTDNDRAFLICALTPEVADAELFELAGVKPKQFSRNLQRIRGKLSDPNIFKYLYDPSQSVLTEVDNSGVPVDIDELVVTRKLRLYLKRVGITKTSQLEALKDDEIDKLPNLAVPLLQELLSTKMYLTAVRASLLTRTLQNSQNN